MQPLLSEPPKITSQPGDLEDIFLENTVTFAVEATGAQPLRYHWEWNVDAEDHRLGWTRSSEDNLSLMPLPSGGDRIQGVETATLTIDKVQKSDEGQYRCVVSNGNGSGVSKPATLKLAGW